MIPGKSDLRGESESAVASEFASHLLTTMPFQALRDGIHSKHMSSGFKPVLKLDHIMHSRKGHEGRCKFFLLLVLSLGFWTVLSEGSLYGVRTFNVPAGASSV